MLWICGHYKYLNSFSARTVFRRQILTSKDDPRAERVNDNWMSAINSTANNTNINLLEEAATWILVFLNVMRDLLFNI